MRNKVATVTENVAFNEKDAVDLDQALAVAGIGKYNIKYSLVLALFLIAAIIDPMGYAFVLPASNCDLNMSDAIRGFISSIPYIGVVTTSFPWGYLIDTQGRKRMAILGSVAAGCLSILSAFMPELISFIVCKFLCALCFASPAAVPYTFISEILPPRHRDVMMSITNALQVTGSVLVPLLAWAILPLEFRLDFGMYEFRSWRLLTIVYGSFFLIASFLMSFGPESPKYLISQQRHDEAMKVLQAIYAGNKNKAPEDYPVKRLKMYTVERVNTSFFASLKVQSVPLSKPPYLKWMCLNGFLLFGNYAVINGLYMWVPDLLNRVMSGDGESSTACAIIVQRLNQTAVEEVCDDSIDTLTYIINAIANLCCAVIAVAVSASVNIIGKKNLIVTIYAIIGIFIILINFITQDIIFAVLLSSIPITSLVIGPVNAFVSEMFPTHLRGMAVNLCMMMGRFGSVIGTNIAGTLLNASCETTFYLFGGLLLVCAAVALLLPKSQTDQLSNKKKNIATA